MAMNAGAGGLTIDRMNALRLRWIPISLILLSLIPMGGGAFRVTQLASDAEVTEANARFFGQPMPVLLHIFGASLFLVLGAFQFDAALRRKRTAWHRFAGRITIPCGLVAALSGVWMALFYDLPAEYEGTLTWVRVFFGSAMAAALIAGFAAIRRRDYATHRAWMMRGYAIGLGAGTQAFTLGGLLVWQDAPTSAGVLAGHVAGWVINLAVAEWYIRSRRSVSTPAAVVPT